MTKKQIDFQVQVALDHFIEVSSEISYETDSQMQEEYRQILEGFVMREMARRE